MAINTSDPKVQKALLVVLLLAGGCYGYWMYVLNPLRESVDKAESELATVRQSVQTARAVVEAADTAALRKELEKRRRELDLARQLLPDRENLPALLRRITRLGDVNNLEFALFEPQAPVQHELYQERPFRVTVRGGYHETARFLSEVADMDLIVKPTSVSLVRDTRQDAPEDEVLTAELTLSTYLLIAAPPPADEQQGRQKGGQQ